MDYESLSLAPMLIGLAGGLALFLHGMTTMSNAMRAMAGSRLKTIMAGLAGNRFSALLTGIGITSIVQSSTVTSLIAIGGALGVEMLGLDPLYVANEGVLLAFVPAAESRRALDALQSHELGRNAVAIGRVVAEHPRVVALRTTLGGTRVVDLLPGDQLPRIC